MDVKLFNRIATLGAAMLTLVGLCPLARGDDGSSMVFVTATDAAPRAQAAPSAGVPAEPSQLVIQIADDAAPARSSRSTPAAQGELTVVANGGLPAPVGAMIADNQVIPAGSLEGIPGGRAAGLNWGNVLAAGPRRPAASAGIQGPQRAGRSAGAAAPASRAAAPAQPDLNFTVERAMADAPVAYDSVAYDPTVPAQPRTIAPRVAAPPAAALVKSPADHAKELLVSAYQLSLSASTEAEFSQIVQWCARAARAPLDAESRKFGSNLSAWALNRRGQARADENQTDLAVADFGAALEADPNNWKALHNKAVTLAQRGQFAEAFDDLCRVIQLKPDFAKAYSNRATLYVQAGDYDHAVADYDAAIAADPKLLPALVGRGRVCHIQGNLDEALVSLDAAVKLAESDADIVCSRADLLADLGRYEDALMDYAQAIDLNSKFEHAYRNGAWLLATCPEESIRDAEGALAGAQAALDCGYGDRHAALDTMAAALANAGRYEEAGRTIQQAIEVAPEESREAYQARRQLYESGQAYRTTPVGAVAPVAAIEELSNEQNEGEQAAVYVEE